MEGLQFLVVDAEKLFGKKLILGEEVVKLCYYHILVVWTLWIGSSTLRVRRVSCSYAIQRLWKV